VRVPARRNPYVVRRGEGGDPPPFADPAGGARVRLENVRGAGIDELGKSPPSRLDLAGRDRDRGAPREGGVGHEAVRQRRLLEPPDVVSSQSLECAQRLTQRFPAVVDVEREAGSRLECAPRARDAFDVLIERQVAELHLEVAEAELLVTSDLVR